MPPLTAADPESGTTSFTYDSIGSGNCAGTYNGDLVKRQDAVGNVTCYAYDVMRRVTDVTYPAGAYEATTPDKHFVYDSATVNGQTMQNAKGRLAEAYTGTAGSKITDLGFSYGPTGLLVNVYQKSLNSGGYYRASAAYWPHGLVNTLNLYNNSGGALLPTFTYAPEGQGRVDTVSASSGQNPVTDTAYNSLYGGPTGVTYGSLDSDAVTYDANTGRMTQYKFDVGSPVQSVIGNLTWNANRTLRQLGITDPFNSANQQTCTYGYDDLSRINSNNCGTKPSQTFSYGTDNFGNISKTGSNGGISFLPTYNPATNRITTVGSQTFSYDANGNLTSTGSGTGSVSYTWDAEGHMKTDAPFGATSVTLTYDALGRMVEQARGTSYTQIVYGPLGNKLALMNGQTLTKAFVPLPAGATAVYAGATLSYYRHPDWLGSSRFASTPTRTMRYDGAYAPYGENYAETGTTDRDFTGQHQDTTADLYDFMFREYNYTHGRWISPDPLAGSILNPQSLNRYAYVLNSPTNLIDPLGLQEHGEQWPPGAPSWWINAVEDCRRRGDGGCLRTLYTNGWGSGTSLHCQWDGIWDNCSDIFGPMTEPLVLFDPGEANSEGIIRGPGVAILPADPTLPRIGPALDAVTPTIGPAPESEKPTCIEYYLNELTGGLAGFLSSIATDKAIDWGSAAASNVVYDNAFRKDVKKLVPGLRMTPKAFRNLGQGLKLAPVAAAAYSVVDAVRATYKVVDAKFSGGCRSPRWPF